MAIQFTGGQKIVSGSGYSGIFSGQTAWGISFWLRIDSFTGWGTDFGRIANIWDPTGAWSLYERQQASDGTFYDDFHGNTEYGLHSLAVSTIYHYMATYDGSSENMYANGTKYVIGSVNDGAEGSTGWKLRFGDVDGTTIGTAHITLDSIAIWSGYAPTTSDAAAIHSGSAFPNTIATPCTAWFKLNGPTGNTVSGSDAALTDFMANIPALSAVTGSPQYVVGFAPSGSTFTQLSQIYLSQVADGF